MTQRHLTKRDQAVLDAALRKSVKIIHEGEMTQRLSDADIDVIEKWAKSPQCPIGGGYHQDIFDLCADLKEARAKVAELEEQLLECDKVNPGVLKAVARRRLKK